VSLNNRMLAYLTSADKVFMIVNGVVVAANDDA
jgi:sulfur transfer complex TusBCD TusB component (DsrH family)